MAVSKFPAPEAAEKSSFHTFSFRTQASDIDLREIFRKIWRRKTILISITILGTVLAALVLVRMTPQYTGTALVMVDPRKDQVVNFQAVLSGLPADQETIDSEIQVLKSRGLAERVIRKLKLYNDPVFNPELSAPDFWSRVTHWLNPRNLIPGAVLDLLSLRTSTAGPTEEQVLEKVRVTIVDRLLGRLAVERVGRSRVITISVSHPDPARAAEIANTFADLYIVEQLEAKFDATRRATEWLQDRLSGLKAQVEKSEKAVEDFRKESGLVEGKGVTLVSQQAAEINSQLILARSARAEAGARLQQVQDLLKHSDKVDSVAEVLNSRLIQTLRSQEADLQRRAAELSQEYGPKHPKMINIHAEIRDLEGKITAEVNKIIQNLRNEVAVSKAREDELARNLRQSEARVASMNERQVQLHALQREANANRALYETFLNRFKETSQQEDFQRPDARVISKADTPTTPSAPKKMLLLIAAFVLSGGAGLALVFLLESLDKGFRSMEQIEAETGVPALGLVPALSGLGTIGKEPQDIVLERPNSAFSESVRALHAGILLSNVDSPPKTVMLTSSLPSEGKTSLSISLARLVARTGGKRVLIMDCDLRRPLVHRHLGLPAGPGLVQLMAEDAKLEDVLRRDEASGAYVLTSGGTPPNPTDLLASEHFSRLLKNLKSAFDLIVIDSSPVLAVSDSRVLSRFVDKTIFVVRWVETRREVARMGLKQVIESGCDLAGVVLSMVNVKKHSRYGYGDSGYYYGRYRKYYTD